MNEVDNQAFHHFHEKLTASIDQVKQLNHKDWGEEKQSNHYPDSKNLIEERRPSTHVIGSFRQIIDNRINKILLLYEFHLQG